MADGQVVFEIVGDSKGINQTVRQVTNDIQQESKKWDQAANKATGDIEKSFATMAGNIVGKLAAAGITGILLNWGKAAVEAASDLREVQNVVDVTFGSGSAKIETWAKKATTQFGLTETQAKKFASTLGAMMKSSGLAGDEILDMSTDLAGLAADMASFYNLDFEEAFSKIRSGMSGMTMPLKELGIDMSVANLNAFALQKGLSKTFDQMTQSEQTVLRYQYLMQATADAQGDFARTSDEYANGMRKLQTNLETIKTKLGNVLVDIINPLISGVNALFPEDDTGRTHTVLDDFSQIDANTESQLQKITDTAADARDLNNILDEIASNNKGDVLSGLATGANALTSGSVTNWQNILGALTIVNGLENLFGTDSNADQNITDLASALAGSSVDQSKADAWKTFLGALNDNADAVSKLTGQSVDDTKTWLEDLAAAANTLDEGSAEGWNTLLGSFLSGINLDTPEGNQFREALAQSFLAMGSESEEAAAGLQLLGYDTDMIADKQRLWLETCKKLVDTIPGLSEIINTETGEVKGGTQAVADYVDEWEKAQKKMAYVKDLQAKEKALETEFADFAGLEIDVEVARRRLAESRAKVLELFNEYGLNEEDVKFQFGISDIESAYRNFNIAPGSAVASALRLSSDQVNALKDAASAYQGAINKERELSTQYAERKAAYDEANSALQERKEIVEELVGSLDDVTTAESTWTQTMVDDATNALPVANEALKALADYYENYYDKVKSSVDGVVKGFDEIGKAGDDLREKQQSLSEEYAKTELEYAGILQKFGGGDQALQYMSDHWEELTDDEKDAYNALAKLRNEQDEVNKSLNQFKPEGMKANLQSQIEFMNEYLDNLEWAKEAGLSDELLASLSDGSQESAEYLAGLREGGADAAKEVDDLYQQVQEKKKEFTQELTDQQLTVDQTYQDLLEKAKEAIAGLDMEEDAKNNAGKTVVGIIEGISANVPGVADAVDSVLAELSRLSGFGIGFYRNIVGEIEIGNHTSGLNDWSNIINIDGSHETGLNYVPFTGYLASLHEGEGILSAEENRIWQRFRNGQPGGMDYDALGGVMRDNVRAGGNVYLDGRTVGRVISDMQGDQYRALQRSGWQQ